MHYQGLTFYEREGSPSNVQLTQDESRLTRVYLVRYDDIYNAYRALLGQSVKAPGSNSYYISRPLLPHSCGVPGQAARTGTLYALSIPQVKVLGMDGHDVPRELAHYRAAELTVQYCTVGYKVLPNDEPSLYNRTGDAALDGPGGIGTLFPDEAWLTRFVTPIQKPFSRIITLPRALNRWVQLVGDPASAPVYESLGVCEGGHEVTYVHHLRPDNPSAVVRPLLNTVNATTFDDWPPETLLLTGVDVKPMHQIGGSYYDAQFQMKGIVKARRTGPGASDARPELVGWNHFMRYMDKDAAGAPVPARYDYRRVSADATATGTAPYRRSDFRTLFRPAQP